MTPSSDLERTDGEPGQAATDRVPHVQRQRLNERDQPSHRGVGDEIDRQTQWICDTPLRPERVSCHRHVGFLAMKWVGFTGWDVPDSGQFPQLGSRAIRTPCRFRPERTRLSLQDAACVPRCTEFPPHSYQGASRDERSLCSRLGRRQGHKDEERPSQSPLSRPRPPDDSLRPRCLARSGDSTANHRRGPPGRRGPLGIGQPEDPLEFVLQDQQLGTGHAVQMCREALQTQTGPDDCGGR